MTRVIDFNLMIDWDFNGSFTDESARLITASGDMRLSAPGQSIISPRGFIPQMNLTLANYDGRYSPQYTGGALYSAIQNGGAYHAPVYLEVSIDGGANYDRVFTGVIKIPTEQTVTPSQAREVRIACRGREEAILNKRVSTLLTDFANFHDNGKTEEEVIAKILTDAGLNDGADFISQSYGGTATLDFGIFTLPWFWLNDESPVEDCWNIAAACGGRFYADPDGVFRYENAQHWIYSPHTTSQKTYDRNDFTDFAPRYNDKELYNSVSVEVSPRQILSSSVVWQPDEVINVPANDTYSLIANLRQPIYSITAIGYDAVTSGGVDISSDVTMSTQTNYAQRIEITFTNANTIHAAYLRNFSIVGSPVSGAITHEEKRISVDSFWTNREGRTRRLRGNPYIQTRAQAAFIAEMLRDVQELARVTYVLDETPGLPSLRLGDRATVNDAKLMSAAEAAFVVGIRWNLGSKFHQTIECIAADDYYPYMDAPGYFEMDTHNTGSAKKVFY